MQHASESKELISFPGILVYIYAKRKKKIHITQEKKCNEIDRNPNT